MKRDLDKSQWGPPHRSPLRNLSIVAYQKPLHRNSFLERLQERANRSCSIGIIPTLNSNIKITHWGRVPKFTTALLNHRNVAEILENKTSLTLSFSHTQAFARRPHRTMCSPFRPGVSRDVKDCPSIALHLLVLSFIGGAPKRDSRLKCPFPLFHPILGWLDYHYSSTSYVTPTFPAHMVANIPPSGLRPPIWLSRIPTEIQIYLPFVGIGIPLPSVLGRITPEYAKKK